MNHDNSTIELATYRPESAPNEAEPVMGEQTKTQASNAPMGVASIAGGVWGFFDNQVGGFGLCPWPTINTYRMMRDNADVAIGRMCIHAPIKASSWTVEVDDDAPSDLAEMIEDWVTDFKTGILEHALRMLDYGRSSFELVWGEQDGAIVPEKYKPLLVDITTVNVDADYGSYAGLRNGTAKLDPANTLHFVFDSEAGDFYGRSLFENIRKYAWWPWLQTLKRGAQFTQKIAGSRLVIHYVPGKGLDKAGNEKDNYEMATGLAAAFAQGDAVLVPIQMVPWAESMIRGGVDPSKLLSWQFSYIEPGTGHGPELLSIQRAFAADMLRGLMVPERTVTEGKFGTKAESEQQATIALSFSEQVQSQIIDNVNWYAVDRFVRLNYGDGVVGKGRVMAEPLMDEKKGLIRQMILNVLGNASNADLWQTLTDVEAQLEAVGIPKAPEGQKPVTMPEPGGDVLDRMRQQLLNGNGNGNGAVDNAGP